MQSRKTTFALVGVLAVLAGGCHSATPGPGEVAVIVDKPWFFGDGGIRDHAVPTGRKWMALSSEALVVDVKPMQFYLSIDDMFSKDNVPLDFNAAMRVRVTDPVRMAKEFGIDDMAAGNVHAPRWYWNNVHKPWERAIRRAVKVYGMTEMVSDAAPAEAPRSAEEAGKSTIERIDEQVEAEMKAEFKAKNLPAELIDLTIGRANPPEEIKHQRVETARQEQLQKTEVQRRLAELERAKAEDARARADNAYREAMQLSPDQFVRLEAIKVQREVCKDRNCTFVYGGGASPVFDISRK